MFKEMDTKTLIIDNATALFQQKGYQGVGLSEILKACDITKGSLYHHFPKGKEELLIACLQSLKEAITFDLETIFEQYPTTLEAIEALIDRITVDLDREGAMTRYTISSIVSDITSLSEPVRNACHSLYTQIQGVYFNKLVTDGFSEDTAHSIALTMTASIEGGVMLCLTQASSDPLKTISLALRRLISSQMNEE